MENDVCAQLWSCNSEVGRGPMLSRLGLVCLILETTDHFQPQPHSREGSWWCGVLLGRIQMRNHCRWGSSRLASVTSAHWATLCSVSWFGFQKRQCHLALSFSGKNSKFNLYTVLVNDAFWVQICLQGRKELQGTVLLSAPFLSTSQRISLACLYG